MPQPIENYVEQSERLAQDVINTWCSFTKAAHDDALTADFKEVFELTYEFRQAVRMADNWRGADMPTPTLDAEVEQKRLVFAQAFKAFPEKHEA
jgi:hypothetical protein